MDEDTLKSLASDLAMAAQCLRHAWATMKRHGMENTAKELADTVLDVETAAEEINVKFSANGTKLTGAPYTKPGESNEN